MLVLTPEHQWVSCIDLTNAFFCLPLADHLRDIFSFSYQVQQLRYTPTAPRVYTVSRAVYVCVWKLYGFNHTVFASHDWEYVKECEACVAYNSKATSCMHSSLFSPGPLLCLLCLYKGLCLYMLQTGFCIYLYVQPFVIILNVVFAFFNNILGQHFLFKKWSLPFST